MSHQAQIGSFVTVAVSTWKPGYPTSSAVGARLPGSAIGPAKRRTASGPVFWMTTDVPTGTPATMSAGSVLTGIDLRFTSFAEWRVPIEDFAMALLGERNWPECSNREGR